jgi:uncharacterized damage-inducible protein DinB
MTATQIIIVNFSEIRRRSEKVWRAIPASMYHWKPDTEAMSTIEMIRHTIEGEHIYHNIIEGRGELGNFVSPWEGKIYESIEAEIEFAKPYRNTFFEMINTLTPADLDNIEIVRTTINQRRKLGDYLNRIAYHESVHTGQLLSYLRTFGVDRPNIWD